MEWGPRWESASPTWGCQISGVSTLIFTNAAATDAAW